MAWYLFWAEGRQVRKESYKDYNLDIFNEEDIQFDLEDWAEWIGRGWERITAGFEQIKHPPEDYIKEKLASSKKELIELNKKIFDLEALLIEIRVKSKQTNISDTSFPNKETKDLDISNQEISWHLCKDTFSIHYFSFY